MNRRNFLRSAGNIGAVVAGAAIAPRLVSARMIPVSTVEVVLPADFLGNAKYVREQLMSVGATKPRFDIYDQTTCIPNGVRFQSWGRKLEKVGKDERIVIIDYDQIDRRISAKEIETLRKSPEVVKIAEGTKNLSAGKTTAMAKALAELSEQDPATPAKDMIYQVPFFQVYILGKGKENGVRMIKTLDFKDDQGATDDLTAVVFGNSQEADDLAVKTFKIAMGSNYSTYQDFERDSFTVLDPTGKAVKIYQPGINMRPEDANALYQSMDEALTSIKSSKALESEGKGKVNGIASVVPKL